MKIRKLTAVVLAAMLLLCCAWTSAEGVEGRPAAEGATHVTVGNATRVSGSFFTSQFGNNTSDIDVRSMIHGYDPVVWTSQLTFDIDPQVARTVTLSASPVGTTYTIVLQQDLKWNDGTPITARDYVFTILMESSPAFAALGADIGVWSHLVGYDEYAAGRVNTFSGVRLIDEYIYSVTVKADMLPYFYEYSYLSVTPGPMNVIAPGCRVVQTEDGAMIADNVPGEPVQTVYSESLLRSTLLGDAGYLHMPEITAGPYRLVSFDAATGVVEFEKNTYYKGNYEGVKPWIDTVTLVPVTQDGMLDDL